MSYQPVRITGSFANKGDKTTRHAHDRAHRSGVEEGAALIRMWDIRDESVEIGARLSAGCYATVPAEWKHEIEALEPGTRIYCEFENTGVDPSGSHRLEAEGKPWR